MKKPDSKISSVVHSVALAAAPILLLVVLYFVCFAGTIHNYTVTVAMRAERTDTLTFYWPNKYGHYDQTSSADIRYTKGKGKYEAHLFLDGKHQNLRLDPGVLDNSVIISAIKFTRLGSEKTWTSQELADSIDRSEDASFSMTEEGVKIDFDKGDAKVFLSSHPLVLPSRTILTIAAAAVIILSLYFVYLARRILAHFEQPFSFHVVFGSFILAALGLVLHWPLYLMLPVSIYLAYGLFLGLTVLFRAFSHHNPMLFIKPFIISSSFLAFLMVPMMKTIDPGTRFLAASFTAVKDIIMDGNIQPEERLRLARDKFEESFLYRFAFRKDLINFNSTVKIFGFGFSPTSKAIVGQDGMFFEGYGQRRVESDLIGSFDNVTDYMGLIPFSNRELDEWLVCLEERYYWLQEYGIDYVFVLAPTKALVYPEKLPARILEMKEKVSKPTRYEQLVAYLKAHSVVPVVDLQTPLVQAKEQESLDALLYYKTDFHWNNYGSFLAYQAIVNEINRAYPKYALKAASLDEFIVRKKTDWVHRGFITLLGLDPMQHQNETYLTFQPKRGSVYYKIGEFAEKGIDDYSIPDYLPETYNSQKTRIRKLINQQGKVRSIFVIGDSFSEKYFGYFSGHARETVNFRTVYSFFPELFERFSPDLVIQEVLNMYLLQEPPKNSQQIKQARLRALKEKKNAGAVGVIW